MFRKVRSRMKTSQFVSSSGCLHLLFGWNPYCITRLFLDNVFHFFVELFWCVSLDNSSEIFPKLVLKLVGALVQFASLKIQGLQELKRVLKVSEPALQSFACSSLTRSPCIWAGKKTSLASGVKSKWQTLRKMAIG